MKNEMRVKMRWTLLNQDAKRGTQKKREGANTHTNTPSPERANPEKAREKKKGEADGHGPRPAEGGEDGSAWANLPQRKPTKTSARDGANLPGEKRKHEIGDQWGTSWWKTKTKTRTQFLIPKGRYSLAGTVVKSCPNWHETAFKFQRIRCTICLTSPNNHQKKKTTPEGHEPAWSMYRGMLQYDCKSCCEKEVFWMFGMESHWKRSIPQDSLGQPEQRDFAKWCITVRQAVALYFNELLD